MTFAPATSGSGTSATGVINALNRSGTDSGVLGVHTVGLAGGTYTVSGVSLSGTTPVTVGTFDVKAPISTGSSSTIMRHRQPSICGKTLTFPAGLDPFDVASLAISDSNANVLFTADLATISDATFVARAPVVSGTANVGIASVQAVAKGGGVHGELSLRATGLIASTTYNYSVDGISVGTVTSDANGRLKLVATEKPTGGTLPSGINLFMVTTVTVTDTGGNLVLSASF